ncbi:TPA: hypothetical protein ACJ2QH_000588 [Klebsiella pneumoniae]
MFKQNENIDGAGFVKFRALVYEGKETDFDDHDITLWLVGAKALKLMPGADRCGSGTAGGGIGETFNVEHLPNV